MEKEKAEDKKLFDQRNTEAKVAEEKLKAASEASAKAQSDEKQALKKKEKEVGEVCNSCSEGRKKLEDRLKELQAQE